MNETEQTIFNAIVGYKRRYDGCTPTYIWLRDECNLSSTSIVSYWVKRMLESGRLRRGANSRDLMVPGARWSLRDPLLSQSLTIRPCEPEVRMVFVPGVPKHGR